MRREPKVMEWRNLCTRRTQLHECKKFMVNLQMILEMKKLVLNNMKQMMEEKKMQEPE